ncbi:serine/arginine-rich splicing factor 7 [Diaphorina citri]|uniref:Serine/arginine-rich splicing factor 7 n=1 Tax=Diaphorina citri TaxID=121845 RepID=A0A3Q0JA05_DIACI|nr:serine/arginine-rich splicing factor 7 [Diaphorina citri]
MSRGRDRRSSNDDCKIYVGDLSTSSTKEDIEDAFSYYGPIKNVWVARNPPGFGFVEFEDRRDAEDAVRGFDGREINGRRVRVEMSNPQKMRGRSNGRSGGDRGYRGSVRARGRPFNPDDKCYECGGRGHYARDCRSRRSGGGGRRRRLSLRPHKTS